jgi:hypothetical protein
VLTWFDRASGQYLVVRPSALVVNTVERTIILVLEARSTPSLLLLGGTVFTIAVPVTVDVGPALAQSGLVQATMALDRGGAGTNSLAAHEAAAGVAGAAVFVISGGRSAVGVVNAGQEAGGGAAEGDGLGVRGETGPLRELPAVRPVVTELPGLPLTPAGFEIDPGQQASQPQGGSGPAGSAPTSSAPPPSAGSDPAGAPAPAGGAEEAEEVGSDLAPVEVDSPGLDEGGRAGLLLAGTAWLAGPPRPSTRGGTRRGQRSA